MSVLSIIYGFFMSVRNFLYNHNILYSKEINGVEVICIGNITVGGTGKTPAVEFFVRKFLIEDKKVVMISRGYKGKRKRDTLVVSDGVEIFATVDEAGDEAFMTANKLKIPVIVSKNRYKGALLAAEQFSPDIILLDDGFQHRSLKRNKDIVLIDSTNPFGGGKCLPKGRLREPISGLNRAHEIIVTKTNFIGKSELERILSKLKLYHKKIFLSEYVGVELYSNNGNKYSTEIIRGNRILIFSGIANPENFEKSIAKFNPEKIKTLSYKDHYRYSYKDIEKIINLYTELDFDYIITTEKDFVKLENIVKNNSYFWKKLLIIKMELKVVAEI